MTNKYNKWIKKMSKGQKGMWFFAIIFAGLFVGGSIGWNLSVQSKIISPEDEIFLGENVNVVDATGRQIEYDKIVDEIIVTNDDIVLYSVDGEWYEKGKYVIEVNGQ